uniref:Uncharacterized protein n=1 Tax=Haptolina brevifila TaxID=156173 RepID=A0A7S2CUA0_9EUKA|mmetsp:Transcript_28986/g.58406  ORF Transcript_28986/g.58406 Transcript_28986/m.58406 type:complete len:179 (+) Transcript_28986:64-600(+)|eukprot:CAMPEP_0174694362 /NCGR_PEP_ID=MMETSP1094-20130205/988_1 /TAXON_ID=156173 /ORGANISM="Chrysochromulina brevifilum, Strain UTEX LB 985" /LENGTH=178 /DNA_ID=CAMNT_0015890597 /DNA_START=62 /DNA_END=598 /DNA_ORIENTATION=-
MAERVYRGIFCTGHTPMVGATAIQFGENAKHEFEEDYRSAHGMKEKKGPGLAKVYDFREVPKRPSPALPIAGCALARLGPRPNMARQSVTSSKAVGAWWTNPIFMEMKDAVAQKEGPPASMGLSTSSDCGRYFHDPLISLDDEIMSSLRLENGRKRVLPVEENSQFALEELPVQHRLL